MPESGSQPEVSQATFWKRRALVALGATAAVGLGALGVAAIAESGQTNPESSSSKEALHPGDRVETIPGSVIIPEGLNRDSMPGTGGDEMSSALYSDRNEIVSTPIEISTPDDINAKHWLAFSNADGRLVFVAETSDALSQIKVESHGATISLAEARTQLGGIVETTIRSVSKEGITASQSDVEEPEYIAIVEDRG